MTYEDVEAQYLALVEHQTARLAEVLRDHGAEAYEATRDSFLRQNQPLVKAPADLKPMPTVMFYVGAVPIVFNR